MILITEQTVVWNAVCNVKTDEAESRAPATVVLRGTIETPVTGSVDLGACQAVIDTMGDVCVCVDPAFDYKRCLLEVSWTISLQESIGGVFFQYRVYVVHFTMEIPVTINAVRIVYMVPAS